jgi:peptidoglycan/LPS O-acetylase OafA/YrhL
VNGAVFRRDIQGLRAIAVLLVLAYHLWPGTVTGGFVGVDAFFVISGFLITSHLLKDPPRNARGVLEFWGRRIRRLLPAAFLVLVVTAIGARLFMPDTRWTENAQQMIASALYVQNWALAANAVDYLAAAQPPTPFQHYWSLSVEEQFYVLWPLLILAVAWFAARTRPGPRSGATWRARSDQAGRRLLMARIAMGAVIAVSLVWSITATAADPLGAYFVTPTRVWELAVGGFVATLPGLSGLRLPAWVPTRISGWLVDGLAWLGIAIVLVAGLVYTGATPFPGFAALLPVGGAALAILAAGMGRYGPATVLGNRPVQHVGDTSYSIYLWHWPLIVLWPYAIGPITPVADVAIIAATLLLASLSKVWVEDRFRFAPSFQPLVPTFRFAAIGMVVLSLLGGGQLVEANLRYAAAVASGPDLGSIPQADDSLAPSLAPGTTSGPATPAPTPTTGATPAPTIALTTCVGAASMVRGFDACPQDPAAKMFPDPLVASTDKSDAYRDGCWSYAPFSVKPTCQYGSGSIKVALVGNSHAGQWLPALQVLAKRLGWTVTTFLASQCNATNATLDFYSTAKDQGCAAWGQWVLKQTSGGQFDLVVTSERQSVQVVGEDWAGTFTSAAAGYTTYLQQWVAKGTNLLVIRDTPYPGNTLSSVPDCLAAHETNETFCAGTPSAWSSNDPLFNAANALALPGVTILDARSFFCTATTCPAVIGGIVTYFDASHMTATYAKTIAPFVQPTFVAALAGH